jgi:hypothetical protein
MTEEEARKILHQHGFLVDGFWDYDKYLRFAIKIKKVKV